MVIVHLSGGFGNQLFSYAFGYAVAKERGDTLAIDTAIQDMDWFFRNPDILNMDITYDKRVSYRVGNRIWERGPINKWHFYRGIGLGTKVITEREVDELGVWSERFIGKIHEHENIYLKGNWGTEKYFKPVAEEIKAQMVFKEPLPKEAAALYKEIKETPDSVTLHYRRGDYVKLGISPAPAYFIEAMRYVAHQKKTPVFYCFSEDQEWVREQFRELELDIRYPKYKSECASIEDFRLLGAAKHQIISNSSYSWWAAYLNKQAETVVIPYSNKVWTPDFGLEEWIKLPFDTQ